MKRGKSNRILGKEAYIQVKLGVDKGKIINNSNNINSMNYIYAGIWNTIFGYSMGIIVYKFMTGILNIVIIGLISNIISISMSFFTYKIFVFKTRGNWLREYIKCYMLYGLTALLNIFLIWLFVEKIHLNIWITQFLIIIFSIVISYTGHKKFTFNGK